MISSDLSEDRRSYTALRGTTVHARLVRGGKEMPGDTERSGGLGRRCRIAGWGAAVTVILLPALGIQVTDQVNWTLADFVLAGTLVAGVGETFEVVARIATDRSHRAAVAVGSDLASS